MEKVPPPLVVGLDDTWDTKGKHGNVRVSQSGAGSDKLFLHLTLLPSAWNTTKDCVINKPFFKRIVKIAPNQKIDWSGPI